MSRHALGTVAVAALAALVAATAVLPAQAGSRHHYRHGHGGAFAAGMAGAMFGAAIAAPRPVYGGPVYGAPVYVGPAPVYLAPDPIYVEPAPIYVEPAPIYVEQAPIYAEPVHVEPAPDYAPHHRAPLSDYRPGPQNRHEGGPRVVTYDDTVGDVASAGGIEPWSPGWHDYCRSKFRSFDARSGTYLGYDGNRHFCVAR